MPVNKPSTPSDKKNISIGGDVVDSVVIVGDHNVVTKQTTIIQKFFNIFKSDAETLEQRNRRILLNHVENAWIKGVLDASLHGAALLDLGIKQDPEAVTKYPWAIKKESTKETLPAGTSMLEIFDSIGMGRSLLILGAPGSGKTTMLLELARGLIARAREDVTQPIPMVFNLASWTEKLSLADWLAQELNNLYSVPRRTAPDWVKGNKLLLLLDGLDEVRQDSRAKCVEAINEFRKQNGLTSLAVCSRSQDYADLNSKLSFEGAIEVQPLSQGQIAEFFTRFGDEMAGIKHALEKDSALREMAETPLFLSIMLMAYRDKRDVDILVSGDGKDRRKHLFDAYIERMFERPRSDKRSFNKRNVVHWLSSLAGMTIEHNEIPYFLEVMQPEWLAVEDYRLLYNLLSRLSGSLLVGVMVGLSFWIEIGATSFRLVGALIMGGIGAFVFRRIMFAREKNIQFLGWKSKRGGIKFGLIYGMLIGSISGTIIYLFVGLTAGLLYGFYMGLIACGGFMQGYAKGSHDKPIEAITYPGQNLKQTFFFVLLMGSIVGLLGGLFWGRIGMSSIGILIGLFISLFAGGNALMQHYSLRYVLAKNNLLPWRLVPFLDHCVDLIFLRRVGGGYIFIHRLLMEHFAEMYVETTK